MLVIAVCVLLCAIIGLLVTLLRWLTAKIPDDKIPGISWPLSLWPARNQHDTVDCKSDVIVIKSKGGV